MGGGLSPPLATLLIVTSLTAFNCIRNLNQLAKQNHVSIAWIPGHAWVHGNEVVDHVAKSGSKSETFLCPKCSLENETPNHHVGNCKLYQDIRVK